MVVIVGGMGSLFGAVAGSLLYGIVFMFSSSYLPTTGNDCCTQYSIVFTFVLLALVLAFRPQGLFGRDRVTKVEPKRLTERVDRRRSSRLRGPRAGDRRHYWLDPILTPTLIFGLAAASLIFLSAYGGMISLTQTALMGIAGYAIGNTVSKGGAGGESKGLALGWDPTVSVIVLAS